MRTSRISQETTKLFNALATPRRSTRSSVLASSLRGSTNQNARPPSPSVKDEFSDDLETESVETSIFSADIEDALDTRSSSKKRKRGSDSPATTVISTVTEAQSTWTSPRRRKKTGDESRENEEAESVGDLEGGDSSTAPSPRTKAKPKKPARRVVADDGSVTIHPPSNWEAIYGIVQKMRETNPNAPVDTMGCEDLYWRTAPAKEKRYHTLTALMLSSQTKDTVTAVAMQRLHTELTPRPDKEDGLPAPSALTVDNMLSCDAKHLDSLIGKVGFHNNKTRYIKQVAQILHDEYQSDIPSTLEGLLRLPGVGPKMAYLCLSAAWDKHDGIGVDVHVHRITNLWGWHTTKSPEETRMWLEGWLPKEKWHHINKMLVGLGQTVCLPVGRRCWDCDLAGSGLCKSEIRGVKVQEKRRAISVKTQNVHNLKDRGTVEVKEEVLADEH